eukprot:Sro302_g112160.1 acid type B receptor subunit 1 (750) ;mRNA; r:14636-16885
MHGMGMINLQMQSSYQHTFDKQLLQLVQNDTAFQEFVSHTAYPELFANYTPAPEVAPFLYHHLVYDSVIALGLTACDTPGQFSGTELYEQLLQTRFEGVSGFVSFDAHTGTRDAVSTQYRIDNLLLSDYRSTATEIKIDVAEAVWIRGDEIYTNLIPFVYANNSTIPPPSLPPVEGYDPNLMPTGVVAFGYCLGAMMIFLAAMSACWTADRWRSFVVQAAQPVFLLQLCLGVALMGAAIFPLGMQGEESTPQLDMACMSVPWLLFLGFVFALAALMSKTWRVSRIMGEERRALKQLAVSTKDVMAPLFILLPFNIAMLVGWTLVSPYQYTRIPIESYDEYGRNLASFGTCQCTNNWVWLFASLMCFANGLGVLFVAVQCYKTRHVSLFFSETYYLALSLASLTETGLLGGPLIFLVMNQPSAFYLLSTALICIVCLSFLIPIFGFKFSNADSLYEDAKRDGELRDAQRSSRHTGSRHTGEPYSELDHIEVPGHMQVRRIKTFQNQNDDDSLDGCSFKSGRSFKSHKSEKTANSFAVRSIHTVSSKVSRTFSKRLSGLSGLSDRRRRSSRNSSARLSAKSTHSLPHLPKVSELSRASEAHDKSSRPISMSLTELRRPTSMTQSQTLPSTNVSFATLRPMEISEDFTDEGGHDDDDGDNLGRQSFSLAYLKATEKEDLPPMSVSFATLQDASMLSEAFTENSAHLEDDDIDDEPTRPSFSLASSMKRPPFSVSIAHHLPPMLLSEEFSDNS